MYLAPGRRDYALRILLELRGPVLADATVQAGKSVLNVLLRSLQQCPSINVTVLLLSSNLFEGYIRKPRSFLARREINLEPGDGFIFFWVQRGR